MNSSCPRCGGPFHCGVDDAQPCACSTLKLDARTLATLRAQYAGCLCLACLQTLAASPPMPMPDPPPDMKKAGPV
jgi:ribosomal protein L34E